jgi:hypothetical protein
MFKPRKKWLHLFILHRYAGLTIAFFAVLLSITGILLNHTEEFGLSRKTVSVSWLMRMYGIKAPEIRQAYSLDSVNKKRWVVEYGKTIILENQKLDCKVPITGVAQTNELLIVSNLTQLCLFTLKGELIDLLVTSKGSQIKRLGMAKDGKISLDTSTGLFGLNSDFTGFVSQQQASADIEWIQASQAPVSVTSALKRQYKGEGLPLERIILDLHSGRIAGLAGVYFMDFIALLLIFLGISGFIMWAKRRRKTYLRNSQSAPFKKT